MSSQPNLFDAPVPDAESPPPPDQPARDIAVDPDNDVVLEASAGTGKTRVLVERYVRLIERGIAPRHILAITFTRKAAAEMRTRILAALRHRAASGGLEPKRWQEVQSALGEIQISTIDAFCHGLLREFPLEGGVDPAFDVADETEIARFADEALDLTFRAARGLMQEEPVRLILTRVKPPVLRAALASLIDRRHVSLPAVRGFIRRDPHRRSVADAGQSFIDGLLTLFDRQASGRALLKEGPASSPEFAWLAADIGNLAGFPAADGARIQQLRHRLERYFLTQDGTARQRLPARFTAAMFATPEARRRHQAAVAELAPGVLAQLEQLDLDVDRLLARGLLRLLTIAIDKYERLLEDDALLDFAGMLDRSVALLERQEEFARSRLKLQARYHHLLVDEFQDTSRRQWRLIELLIDAWGEGEGVAGATSIFVVGDRKQSIYRFRHAEVTLLDEAARRIGALRPARPVRQAISTSFRAVPEILAFVNALSAGLESGRSLADRFRYGDLDRFPVGGVSVAARRGASPVLGLVAERTMGACAAAVAAEVDRLCREGRVRDRAAGMREVRPDDIAILFRARAGYQYFEEALEARGIRTYVYKGLGFFDAPEIQDVQALIRFLARPESDLRAAEFLRSRIVRLTDAGLLQLAPAIAAALRPAPGDGGRLDGLGTLDRQLVERVRASLPKWLAAAARLPPGEAIDLVLQESAYADELGGRRRSQAIENLKKIRGLIRRVENRGYATPGRLAQYFETLRAGDESNAIVDGSGAVSLMTVHAAKGLEFPIVFLVNLHQAARRGGDGFSVIEQGPDGEPEVAFRATPATELEETRDDEELRRLFYVAATRARDRLYLSAQVDEKGLVPRAARSLASLLPPALAAVFGRAAADPWPDEVEWQAGASSFTFSVCRPPGPSRPSSGSLQPSDAAATPPRPRPLRTGGRRLAVASAASAASAPSAEAAERGHAPDPDDRDPPHSRHERLIGTLVHRLFQREPSPELDAAALAGLAATLIGPEEMVDVAAPGTLFEEAAHLYQTFRLRSDVREALGGGECLYEVPFSYDPPGRATERLRGVVDCLVLAPGGRATVVEFKTGVPRPEHLAQAQIYADAVSAALGTAPVAVRLLYA